VSLFASSKAEALALQHHITPDGDGSGRNGRWTLADVNRKLAMPTKKKTLISPNALILANDNNLSISDIVGTGMDGRILIKDVQKLLQEDVEEEVTLNISPRAVLEATDNGIKIEELKSLVGTGKNGKILLEDVKKHIASSASSSSDDEDED
jgi:pyruvate/2-oxoglutarate dehydrogenase complex dihydrolipoamide acyltransferase (E2) component